MAKALAKLKEKEVLTTIKKKLIESITLELSPEEALVIMVLTGKVSGQNARKHNDKIFNVLSETFGKVGYSCVEDYYYTLMDCPNVEFKINDLTKHLEENTNKGNV